MYIVNQKPFLSYNSYVINSFRQYYILLAFKNFPVHHSEISQDLIQISGPTPTPWVPILPHPGYSSLIPNFSSIHHIIIALIIGFFFPVPSLYPYPYPLSSHSQHIISYQPIFRIHILREILILPRPPIVLPPFLFQHETIIIFIITIPSSLANIREFLIDTTTLHDFEGGFSSSSSSSSCSSGGRNGRSRGRNCSSSR